MLAVLLLEKGQKLCSIPQIMPKILLAQSARAYQNTTHSGMLKRARERFDREVEGADESRGKSSEALQVNTFLSSFEQ